MITAAQREDMLNTISDLSKDAYGFRVRLDYASMTDDELESRWNAFCDELERNEAARKEQEAASLAYWRAHIESLIAHGARDKVTAIRWDMDAMDARMGDEFDPGFYCYLWGIPYSVENEIKEVLA